MKLRNLAAMAAWVALAGIAQAEDTDGGTLSVGVGADYSVGKYGRTDSTDIAYFPFITRYETDRWLLKATLPYVSISGPGTVVGGDRPIVIDATGNAQRRTVSGLGDLVLSAGYTAIAEKGFLLDVTGKVKVGTASESDGLGTGKNDYSLQFDVYRTFGTLTAFAGAGYRWYGDPPGVDLRNVGYGSAGVSYKASAKVSAGFSLDYRQPIISGRDPIVEASPFLSLRVAERTKVQMYVVRGFTDASVDWGGGFVVLQSF